MPKNARPLQKQKKKPVKSVQPTAKTHTSIRPIKLLRSTFVQIKEQRRLLVALSLIAWVTSLAIITLSYESQYLSLIDITKEVTGSAQSSPSKFFIEVGAITLPVFGGSLARTLTEGQQLLFGFLYILLWLMTIWVLRYNNQKAQVTIRDVLYNSSAPLVPLLVVLVCLFLLLLPIALIVALIALLISTGLFGNIFIALVSTLLLLGVSGLALYWLIAAIFGAVIVTIPGTYPFAALRSAREIISGNRLKLFIALMVGIFATILAVFIGEFLLVMLDGITDFSLPFVVTALVQLLHIAAYIFVSAYIYYLYRGILDERSN